jgi:hypothetical protein
MLVNFSEMLRDRQKGMSDYWSAAPADGILAAHYRPNGNSALPFKGQLRTKYITRRSGGRTKDETGQDSL